MVCAGTAAMAERPGIPGSVRPLYVKPCAHGPTVAGDDRRIVPLHPRTRTIAAITFAMVTATIPAPLAWASAVSPEPPEQMAMAVPASFEANLGQAPPDAAFVARGHGYVALMDPDGYTLVSGPSSVRITFADAATHGIDAVGDLPGRSHYLLGPDPDQWVRDVPHHEGVRYREVWPGIDVVMYAAGPLVEYDFLLAPGADPTNIRLAIEGAAPEVTVAGALGIGAFVHHAPVAFQDGARVPVAYRLDGAHVALEVGAYDPGRPLVIDPVIGASTYFGGSDQELGRDVAADASGVYLTGLTTGANTPVTAGATQMTFGGQQDAFITKLSPDLSTILYSTFLGGSFIDNAAAIAVDGSGRAHVVGNTRSADFPVTAGSAQPAFGGFIDAFIVRLSADGSTLEYSTYLGGTATEEARDVAVDSLGRTHVVGVATGANFPVTAGAPQSIYGGGFFDGFAARLNAAGSAFDYVTFLGGSLGDLAEGVAVDAAGNTLAVGFTDSADYPTTAGTFQPVKAVGADGFVTRINAGGTAFDWSTFLGGPSTDSADEVLVDSAGRVVVAGRGNNGFPTTPGAFQTASAGDPDGFVARLTPDGATLVSSTLFGGSSTEFLQGLALDNLDRAFIVGSTNSLDLPVTPDATQPVYGGGNEDGFVAGISADGTRAFFATYLGGSAGENVGGVAVMGPGTIVAGGLSSSADYPTTPGAHQTMLQGFRDTVATRFDLPLADLALDAAAANSPARVGKKVKVDLDVTNAGPAASGPFTISGTLAGDATITKVHGAHVVCTFTATTFTCMGADLAPGDSVKVKITLVPASAGPVVLAGSVEGTAADPDASNNADAAGVIVTT